MLLPKFYHLQLWIVITETIAKEHVSEESETLQSRNVGLYPKRDSSWDKKVTMVVSAFLSRRLHAIPSIGTTLSPFIIGTLLANHISTLIDGVIISRFMIMKYVMTKRLVPVKKTSLYKLLALVTLGLIPTDATWTELSFYGRKSLLTPRQLMWLIEEIKLEARGGGAMSSEEIKAKLEQHIFKISTMTGKIHSLPTKIPDYTLNSFVSAIKAQCIFNIYDTVGNKTESRAIAEWSLRSTLSYAMIVTANHFIPNISQNYFHPKKKDLSKEALELWNIAEDSYNKMIGHTDAASKVKLYPVLPNLVTSTDEVTIFATCGIVNNKETFFIATKPEDLKNEFCHSGARNHYKKKSSGDAHCRGVRIVINCTFTAGGVSAPIFITVFGCTRDEMPKDGIITVAVPGLVAGSHENLYCEGAGFITFVRGRDNQDSSVENGAENADNIDDLSNALPNVEAQTFSKESQVASLYRRLVYYPFIKKIRKDKYNYQHKEDEEVPDYLRAISWMDGCASQIKLITSEENMIFEKKLNITCCKHSASRTAVEQAADTGCMFKRMKQILSDTTNPHSSNSSVYSIIEKALASMEPANIATDSSCTKVLMLPLHKKKAILATSSKLPIATARAYTDANIKKAFMLNGQLDVSHKLVPSMSNLLNTFRGDIEGTCLKKKDELISFMYEEAYTTGTIKETTFNTLNVPYDTNASGEIVSRDFGIRQENRQRAKTLTCDNQVAERREHLLEIRNIHYRKLLSFFTSEQKKYDDNTQVEQKLCSLLIGHQNRVAQNHSNVVGIVSMPTTTTYVSIATDLTHDVFTHFNRNLSKAEMLCFVQVRSRHTIRGGKISYLDIPKNKPALFDRMWTLHNAPIHPRNYPNCPSAPSRE